MAQVGYGPLAFVDGPLPCPPRYSLLGMARKPPVTDDRWINGTSAWQYAATDMGLFDPCAAAGSSGASKGPGVPGLRVDTGSFVQWLAETCTMQSVGSDPGAFRDRAARMFGSWESYLVEQELMRANLLPGNPHLADANVVKLNSASTSPVNGLALLEQAIAASKQCGVIHCTPAMLVAWTAALGGALREENGRLLSPNGNLIVPGYGYDGSAPEGTAAPTGTKEWAYASGPVEVRESDLVVIPDDVSQALNRSTNTITYYAERYYNIVWSRLVQATVLIDRCQTTC